MFKCLSALLTVEKLRVRGYIVVEMDFPLRRTRGSAKQMKYSSCVFHSSGVTALLGCQRATDPIYRNFFKPTTVTTMFQMFQSVDDLFSLGTREVLKKAARFVEDKLDLVIHLLNSRNSLAGLEMDHAFSSSVCEQMGIKSNQPVIVQNFGIAEFLPNLKNAKLVSVVSRCGCTT